MAAKPKEAEIEADSGGDEAAEAEGAQASKRKFKLPPMKIMIIAGAGLLVAGGGGAGAYLFLAPHKGETKHAAAPEVKPAIFVDLPDVLVNLANSGGDHPQYLKVKATLEVPDQALAQKIQPLMPRVVDAFQTYLRELRPIDLDGSAGLYRLKEELTRRVNAAIAPGRVNAVLFKEIVVQ
ncbi:MAG TPA: flagellar basal body-associated protein FliL [Xanthobacteraceae bacterium]|nr:flagellar basal body-associated protein FliL [Xanthobacteraceae bacterium]